MNNDYDFATNYGSRSLTSVTLIFEIEYSTIKIKLNSVTQTNESNI